MFNPLVSICIPTYKNPDFIKRVLDSICAQTFKRVEVIVSDDSPNDQVKLNIQYYINQIDIKYYYNEIPLRSPTNWNKALDNASGEFIMLMHQDDWFATPNALRVFVESFEQREDVDFIFCSNTVVLENGQIEMLPRNLGLVNELYEKPDHLLMNNLIGPPSNVMVRGNVKTRYDERFIWLVDIDYYVRLVKSGHRFYYLDQHLVNIGIHGTQTTEFVKANPGIILKENILYAGNMSELEFRDVSVYDYYWRLLRNHQIRTINEIVASGVDEVDIRPVIKHMLNGQLKLSVKALHVGILSKIGMMLNYWGRGKKI